MFLALALRLVVPSGWMPAVGAGGIKITICSGAGIVDATIGADGKIHKSSPVNGAAKDSPCAFAGVSAADVSPELLLLGWSSLAPAAVALIRYIAIGQGLAALPPPSTGPPSLI